MNHKIQRGETLSQVAARYGTTVEALAQANGIRNANRVDAGQTLKIPTAEEKSASRRERFAAKPDLKSKFGLNPGPTTAPPAARAAPSEPAVLPEAESAPVESASRSSGREIRLRVPFYNQMASGHGFKPGKKSCYLAAAAMARDAGATVLGPAHRIQVATAERRDGSISINPRKATQGREYIDAMLESGKPVVVGVSHKDERYNVDGITDHFVVITGRGTDARGRSFYRFHDPASGQRGSDANAANRFIVQPDGKLVKEGSRAVGLVVDRHFEVSMVRRNA